MAASTQHAAESTRAISSVDLTSEHETDSAEIASTADEDNDFDTDGNVPISIRQAEMQGHTAPLSMPQRVHARYINFLEVLCEETSTQDARNHTEIGLSVAISTANSLQLHRDHSLQVELDLFALALVVHVWQAVCMLLQHGIFSNEEFSLSTYCGSYFVSACSIGSELCKATPSSYKFAVEYWEERLWIQGNRRQWLKKPWTSHILRVVDMEVPHRNVNADRYLSAMHRDGKGALVSVIVAEEAKGEATQLRKALDDDQTTTLSDILVLLASMDDSLLKALIEGQLPRKAEIPDGDVYNAIQICNRQAQSQPGTYLNAICDRIGHSPTPAQWRVVLDHMREYIALDHEYDDFAREVDQLIHPKPLWHQGLADLGLRRYTDWKEVIDMHRFTHSSHRRKWIRYFVDQLESRIEDEKEHAPLSVPVIEVGYSTEPPRRLREHLEHESSNYLMNLAQALFEYSFPDSFRLQQNVVCACFRPVQSWLSEVIVTQLAQGYIDGGGGFSHEIAGRSNAGGYKSVTKKEWDEYEKRVGKTVDSYLEMYRSRTEASIEQKQESMRQQQVKFEVEKRYLESFLGLVESFNGLEQAHSNLRQ